MDHNKIINAAAKHALRPLGLKRDGKSRLWFDDHGWWTIIVEFQPSSWGRGSYLNIGLSWLLTETNHWAFNIGSHEQDFREAKTDDQCEKEIADLATFAARRVGEFRERFATLDGMYSDYETNDHFGG